MSDARKTQRIARAERRSAVQYGTSDAERQWEVKRLIIITRSIVELPILKQAEIMASVRRFDGFSEDNDPYGEHDFGAFDVESVGKVFWKIDYYADDQCRWGSEDPSDPEKCFASQ
ncbi:MAG: DUF3768 domain-containing protein [Bryobacterales bacterium]